MNRYPEITKCKGLLVWILIFLVCLLSTSQGQKVNNPYQGNNRYSVVEIGSISTISFLSIADSNNNKSFIEARQNGKLIWSRSFGTSMLVSAEREDVTGLYLYTQDSIPDIGPVKGYAYRLDSKTGRIIWKNKIEHTTCTNPLTPTLEHSKYGLIEYYSACSGAFTYIDGLHYLNLVNGEGVEIRYDFYALGKADSIIYALPQPIGLECPNSGVNSMDTQGMLDAEGYSSCYKDPRLFYLLTIDVNRNASYIRKYAIRDRVNCGEIKDAWNDNHGNRTVEFKNGVVILHRYDRCGKYIIRIDRNTPFNLYKK